MHFVLALLLLAAPSSSGSLESWPQRFVYTAGANHTLVLLYEDGTASFSSRVKRQDGSEAFFIASRARWDWQDSLWQGRRVLQLHVEGWEFEPGREGGGGGTHGFRFDYLYEPSKLTEIDKTGVQKVLLRNSNY